MYPTNYHNTDVLEKTLYHYCSIHNEISNIDNKIKNILFTGDIKLDKTEIYNMIVKKTGSHSKLLRVFFYLFD